MTALGLIETKGLIPAIESADAMLKAAHVRLLEKNLVGSGLVTITIAGEVSAVKASVEAAAAAVKRISGATLVSEHVIPRPDTGLNEIIATKTVCCDEKTDHTSEPETEELKSEEQESLDIKEAEEFTEDLHDSEAEEIEKAEAENRLQKEESTEVESDEEATSEKAETVQYKNSQLRKMNLSRLRDIAGRMDNLSIQGKEINSARRKELIEAILNAYRKKEE